MEKAKAKFRNQELFLAYDVDSNLGGDEWEKVARWCVDNTTANDVFIEIGAQIGYMSVMVCKYARPKRAILIEPDLNTVKLLEENLQAHADCPYDIVPKLVLDKEGTHEFFINQDNPAQNTIYNREFGNQKKVVLPVTTIDQIVKDFNITDPIVMKIDAEFSEHLIWEGMQESLPLIKAICMEFHKPGLSEIAHTSPDAFGARMMEHFNIRDLNHNNILLYKK